MRFAYADPPYPERGRRHYRRHADFAGDIDYRELVGRLQTYDGWALSTGQKYLARILRLCPDTVRVAVWVNPTAAHPGVRGNWWWSWEPVIVSPGREPREVVRDLLTECRPARSRIIGEKPPKFAWWVRDLMGWREGDTIEDLFPGSGAVAEALAQRPLQLS